MNKFLLTLIFNFSFLIFNSSFAQVAIEWQRCFGGSGLDHAYSVQQTSEGGYVVAGRTISNDGDVTGYHGNSDFWVLKIDGSGNLQWQKCFGGTSGDIALSIQQIADGGYVAAGITHSNDGDVTGNHGSDEIWVIKLDANGNLLWQKCLGGTGIDVANSIQETADGSFVTAGFSNSNNGDVTGNHGNNDLWVVKLDSIGNLLWQKCLGGTSSDYATSVQQTADGGYLVAGGSYSTDFDVTGHHGAGDFWVVKLDDSGNLQWQKCLGGIYDEQAHSVQQTTDGGYVVTGTSNSNDGDVTGNHGVWDYWVVKLDGNGNIQWQKCLGGTGYDIAQSVQQTADGGYVAAGYSNSNDGDVTGHQGGNDYWIVKLDNVGNLQWQKSLGGTGIDEASSITQTTDGGFLVAGSSTSNDGDVTGFHGGSDYWVVKLDGIGNIQWEKCFGGTVSDIAYAVRQTYDGGFVVAGLSNSSNGDVTGNHGGSDHWIIKLNGSGNLQWQQCLGGSGNDNARSVQQTSDSGYVVTGSTLSNNGDVSGNHGGSDYWLVKLDGIGNIQWQVCMGGTLSDQAYSVYQTADEGYFVTGFSISNNGDVSGNHGGWDYWVVKLSPVVGIEEVSSRSSSTLFPNPFSTSATISFGRELRNATFTLYNLLGDVVTETSNIKGDSFQINRGTIPGGVYFYYLKDVPSGQAGEGNSIAGGKVVVL